MNCFYCPKESDLRPYGPNCAMVCFRCAMSTSERQTETEANFVAQLNACGTEAVIDGTNVGPYPLKHNPVAKKLFDKLKGDD